MKLLDYINEEYPGRGQAEVAAALGVTQGHISLLVNDKNSPSLKLALVIFRWSGGKVNLPDWEDSIAASGESEGEA